MIKHPILIDFPETFETERLILRAPKPGDGSLVKEIVTENHDHLKPWMDWAETIPDDVEYEAIMRQSRIEFLKRADLQLLITDKKTGEIIGSTGFHRIDWAIPKVEIGYWIAKKHEGQGLVTETVIAMEKIAFNLLEANRIEIRCDADNLRSSAIPRRLGYTLEATFSNFRRHHLTHELVDVLVFAKTPIAGEAQK